MARIIFFSRDYTSHDHRFLAALAQTDHHIYYLRLEKRGHHQETRALPSGVHSISWVGGNKPISYWDFPFLYRDLKRVIHEYQPDLVQAGPLQSCAFLLALSGYHPLISTSWGYDLLVDARRNFISKWITRYVLKQSDIMIGDCETIRKTAIEFGMPNKRIVTFPWGIQLEHFSPTLLHHNKLIKNPNKLTLISTRNWEPIYGVEDIAHAFTHVAQHIPDLHLIMLGNGSQSKLLYRIFDEGNVSERVSFPGHVTQADLPYYYHQADIYLSASHSDGTSISLLEAMACGLPVIVSDIAGNREWIEHGVQGWLFEKGQLSSLINVLLYANEQRRKFTEMGNLARQIVEKRADWGRNFKCLLNAYDRALQQPLEN